jgi:hypothetical protein
MNQKSMVHLIFIVILAGWHNLLLPTRIAISKLDLHAGPDERDQRPLKNAALLNTSVKSKKLAWENPTAASTYTSRSVTVLSPATTPSVPQYYLGRKTTFLTTKQRAICLQTGGGLRFFTEPRSKEFCDQPKAPLPPPAPNISPPCHPPSLPLLPPSNRAPDLTSYDILMAGLYPRPLTILMTRKLNKEMMTTRATGKSFAAKQQVKEIRQMNKKNHQMQRQQKEEEDKWKRDKAEAARPREEERKAAELAKNLPPIQEPPNADFSKSMHDIMEGVQDMETEEQPGDEDNLELSPFKKCPGSSKTASQRTGNNLVSPSTEQEAIPLAATWTTSFLDTFIYPYSRVTLELAVTLKSDKAFDKFTQVLMSFITNAQMVDPKFVINPINHNSKEKNITSKGKISPNMTKLGSHIKISGNGNAFNKQRVWDKDGASG